jgi:hypothetical protein
MASRGSKKRRRPSADDGLAAENYPRLNEQFYTANPQSYLERRWTNLLFTLGKGDELAEMAREGLEFDGIEVRWPDDPEEVDKEKLERQRFITAESEILLHHASETLLRLYLAHATREPCPWLELARENDFRAFKKKVARLRRGLASGDEANTISWVFYGTDDRERFRPPPPDGQWEDGTENIARFLDYYAAVFLDPSPYNAAKHGLALVAGEASFQIDDGDLISMDGPSIEYLAVKPDPESKRPQWAQETKWVDAKRAIAFIYVARSLIEVLWDVAKAHYMKKKIEGVRFFDKPKFEDALKVGRGGEEDGILTEKMAMHLLYHEDT